VGILRERNKKNKKYRGLRTILDPVRSAISQHQSGA
jgi:hypothetical protein